MVKPDNFYRAALAFDSWGRKDLNSRGWLKATQREVRGLGSRLGVTDVKQEGLREILAGGCAVCESEERG